MPCAPKAVVKPAAYSGHMMCRDAGGPGVLTAGAAVLRLPRV